MKQTKWVRALLAILPILIIGGLVFVKYIEKDQFAFSPLEIIEIKNNNFNFLHDKCYEKGFNIDHAPFYCSCSLTYGFNKNKQEKITLNEHRLSYELSDKGDYKKFIRDLQKLQLPQLPDSLGYSRYVLDKTILLAGFSSQDNLYKIQATIR